MEGDSQNSDCVIGSYTSGQVLELGRGDEEEGLFFETPLEGNSLGVLLGNCPPFQLLLVDVQALY